MEITKHSSVLSALEKRALRFRRKGRTLDELDDQLYQEAIDETGTVDTTGITGGVGSAPGDELGGDNNIALAEYLEVMRAKGSLDDLLRVHGAVPSAKSEGVTRVIYKNFNGLNPRMMDNEKLEKARDLIDELGADVVAYNELQVNWQHKDVRNGLSQLFRGGRK